MKTPLRKSHGRAGAGGGTARMLIANRMNARAYLALKDSFRTGIGIMVRGQPRGAQRAMAETTQRRPESGG
jgi:hypothetical protein